MMEKLDPNRAEKLEKEDDRALSGGGGLLGQLFKRVFHYSFKKNLIENVHNTISSDAFFKNSKISFRPQRDRQLESGRIKVVMRDYMKNQSQPCAGAVSRYSHESVPLKLQKSLGRRLRDNADELTTAVSKRCLDRGGFDNDGTNNPSPSESYAEDTPLTWMFGNHLEVKIVATFLSEPKTDLDYGDIKHLSGVNEEEKIDERLTELEDQGLITCKWSSDDNPTCRLKNDSEIAKQLRSVEETLLRNWNNN